MFGGINLPPVPDFNDFEKGPDPSKIYSKILETLDKSKEDRNSVLKTIGGNTKPPTVFLDQFKNMKAPQILRPKKKNIERVQIRQLRFHKPETVTKITSS